MRTIFRVMAVLGALSSAWGDAPQLINFQGRLLNGTDLVDQKVELSLRLYTSGSGGVPVYEDSNTVIVVDGLYSTYIGDNTVSGSLLSALTNTEVWVETMVNGTALAPRERMVSVGYSLSTRGLLAATNGVFVAQPEWNSVGTNSSYASVGGGTSNFINYSSACAVIAGGFSNRIGTLSTHSVISGGEGNTMGSLNIRNVIAGGYYNSIGNDSRSSAILGGEDNRLGGGSMVFCSILGGQNNTIISNTWYANIVGGNNNQVGEVADSSFIAGGSGNGISNNAPFAFVGGRNAKALHRGALVWGGAITNEIASTAANEVTFRCQGGARFVNSNATLYAQWIPGAANWTIVSDRAAKEHIAAVDTKDVLEKVSRLPISEWNYAGHPQRHIGPMAQDFHAAFPLNDNDKAIDSGDLPGIAFAAIQELARQNADLRAELETLKARVTELSK